MPRRDRKPPTYSKHKASGQAVVTLRGGGRRRDVLLGKYGTPESRQEYARVIAEWEAMGRQPAAIGKGPRDLTVNELMLAYDKHAEGYYQKDGRPTTELDCIRSMFTPLQELYGHTLVREFGPLAAKAVRERMIGNDWARGYVNRSMGRLKRMLKWGVESQLVSADVFAAVDAIAGLPAGRSEARETAPRQPVPEEHIEAVKRVVRQRTRDLIDLMLLTAARPGELLSLTGAGIDQTGPVWMAQLTRHKMQHVGKRRVLFFGPKAQLILRRYLPADPAERLFKQKSFRTALREACKRAGVPRFTPHWLRHTAATQIRELFDAETAQVLLGHAHLSTTELYAQKNVKRAVEVALKVG